MLSNKKLETVLEGLSSLHFHLGNLNLENQNLAEAESCYQEAKKINKNNEIILNLAKVLIAEKKYEEALINLAEIEKKETLPEIGLFYQGQSLYFLNRLNEAKIIFLDLMQKYPNNIKAIYYYADIFFINKDYTKAKKYFKKILELEPDHINANFKLGLIYLKEKKLDKAYVFFHNLIKIDSENAQNYYYLAFINFYQQDYIKAKEEIKISLKLDPTNIPSLLLNGKIAIVEEHLSKAITQFQEILNLEPNNLEANYLLAKTFLEEQKYQPAEKNLKTLLSIDPSNQNAKFLLAFTYYLLNEYKPCLETLDELLKKEKNELYLSLKAKALYSKYNYKEACEIFEILDQEYPSIIYKISKAIALKYQKYPEEELNKIYHLPQIFLNQISYEDDLFNLATGFYNNAQYNEAEICWAETVEVTPKPENFYNLGLVNYTQNKFNKAEFYYKKTVAINPEWVEAFYYLAMSLHNQQKHEEAEKYFLKIIKLKTDNYDYYFYTGSNYFFLKKYEEAINAYLSALNLRNNCVNTLYNIGLCYFSLEKLAESEKYFNQVIAINPNYENANLNLAKIYHKTKEYQKANLLLKKVLDISPLNQEAGNLLAQIYDTKEKECNWENRDEELKFLLEVSDRFIENKLESVIKVFDCSHLTISSFQKNRIISNTSIKLKKFMLEKCSEPIIDTNIYKNSAKRRIKVGFISGCFQNHVVGIVLNNFFEYFDRKNIELFVLSYGNKDFVTKRISNNVEHFIDFSTTDYVKMINKIVNFKIDILIDINMFSNYTMPQNEVYKNSPAIFRLAPIQMHYLELTASYQTKSMDYVVTDKTVTPIETENDYNEKFLYLPNTYLPYSCNVFLNNRYKKKDVEIPEESFVFCSFNNSFKIDPLIFDTWLEILKAVPNSILWLSNKNIDMINNLKNYVANNNVDPNRLLFRGNYNNHLDLYQIADLALDPYCFNGHTTTMEVVYANLPIVTCLGNYWGNRVSASILFTNNLPELVTYSLQEYKDLCIELATNKEKLLNIKNKLIKNNKNSPLFNTKLYVKNFENGLNLAWENFLQNNAPKHIYVEN